MTPARYSIDPDITTACTIDSSFYRDRATFALARERIFARSWQWIGDLADVAEPGSLSPRELLAGHLDEPLLLARDKEGALRCLSNVCTHRGNLLVKAPCRGEQIRCGYHSRRFDMTGRMTFMPEFSQAKNFPSATDHLPQVPFGEFAGQAFASIAPSAPLEAVFGDVAERLAWMPFNQFRHDPSRDRDFDVAAHWALYVENYLEGLHIPFLHPALNQVLDMRNYRYELHRYANLQLALAKDGESAFDLPPSSPEHGRRVAAYYYWVFPNLMLKLLPVGPVAEPDPAAGDRQDARQFSQLCLGPGKTRRRRRRRARSGRDGGRGRRRGRAARRQVALVSRGTVFTDDGARRASVPSAHLRVPGG